MARPRAAEGLSLLGDVEKMCVGKPPMRRIVAAALIALWGCRADKTASQAERVDMETKKPTHTYKRGPLEARLYYESKHPVAHEYRAWCVVRIDDIIFKPFAD